MMLNGIKITLAWQFKPSTNQDQPPFVSVHQAFNGPRAVVRPPAGEAGANVLLHLSPGDFLIGLDNGVYVNINGHTAYHLKITAEAVEADLHPPLPEDFLPDPEAA